EAVDVDCGPLFEAVKSGDRDMVEWLLERGADPNRIKKGYRYALGEAARIGSLDILDTLLNRGADVRYEQGDVFRSAIWGGEKTVSRLLVAASEAKATATEREAYLD